MTPPAAAAPVRTPGGFYLAGGLSALFLALMGFVLFILDGEAGETALTRGMVAVLAALSAVVTEALWRARPWAARASWALAIAFVAAVVIRTTTMGPRWLEPMGVVLVCCLCVVGPIVGYIHRTSRKLFPRRPAPGVAPAQGPAAVGPGAQP
jgi:peptidoglycan/LPS O-acetylase OafA/YrhL